MKVLFVDSKLTGHHVSYVKKLSNSEIITPILYLPEKCSRLDGIQRVMESNPHTFLGYLKWIKEIAKVAEENKVDIIHFLYGDVLYKGFGIGLGLLSKYKIVSTFHQVRRSALRDFSRKHIFRKIDSGVVHTNKLEVVLKKCGIKNISHIEYPRFNASVEVKQEIARDYFSIPHKVMTLVALGGTRKDKGLDILLDALEGLDCPFHLLIAGKEETITREFIEEKITNYKENVTVVLRFLSEDEMNLALSCADIVILPYRKIFDGASGPLADGVWNKKIIIGPNHGSLGDIIEKNNLGVTFEAENAEDLRAKIKQVLQGDVMWNCGSEKYRNSLDPDYFQQMYEKIYFN